MKREDVLRIYDKDYSAIYDASFLVGENFRECTEFEVGLIADLLRGAKSWLDVACGTGYFLSRFPDQERAGLDISPAMLDVARRANPGVTFYEQDFREPMGEWINHWDFVSCMWYAYCYADSVPDVRRVIHNLASWTSPNGTCFLPVCDPNVLCKTKIPYQPPPDSDDGRLFITAITWTWIDEPIGKRHDNLVAPTLNHVEEMLRGCFEEVRLIDYPCFQADCLESRKAFVARNKIIKP
jgi:SAM-dependent methyltransferase